MTDNETPAKYNVAAVEAAILEAAILEAAQAIRGLREFGLFKGRGDEIVEPTPAALRAVALHSPSPL